MATTPTNNPIPSEDPRDLKFNAGKIDEVMTSDAHYYVDRFGVKRWTIAGFQFTAEEAIRNYGYITMDSFEDGATLTLPNQVLRWESNGEYYRWDGDWSQPKVVAPNSTPDSAGGIGAGAWVGVGDASLRSDLGSVDPTPGGTIIGLGDGGTVQGAISWTTLENQGYNPRRDNSADKAFKKWIDKAKNGYSTGLFLSPNTRYPLKETYVLDFPHSIKGVGSANYLNTGQITGASGFIDARDAGSSDFLIHVANPDGSTLVGWSWEGFAFWGEDRANPCVLFTAAGWAQNLTRVAFWNIRHTALATVATNDGTYVDLFFGACGGIYNGKVYYGFDMAPYVNGLYTGSGAENSYTNCSTFYRLHMEYCRYAIRVQGHALNFHGAHIESGHSGEYQYEFSPMINIYKIAGGITFSQCNFSDAGWMDYLKNSGATSETAAEILAKTPSLFGTTNKNPADLNAGGQAYSYVTLSACEYTSFRGYGRLVNLPDTQFNIVGKCQLKQLGTYAVPVIVGPYSELSDSSYHCKMTEINDQSDPYYIYAAAHNNILKPAYQIAAGWGKVAGNTFFAYKTAGATATAVAGVISNSTNSTVYGNRMSGFTTDTTSMYGSKIWGGMDVVSNSDTANRASFIPGGVVNYTNKFTFQFPNNYTNAKIQLTASSDGVVLGPDVITGNTSLGTASAYWKNAYFANAPIIVSDAEYKDHIRHAIGDEEAEKLMAAVGSIPISMWQMKAAIEEKGSEDARWHVGVIAQQLRDAIINAGLDWKKYGLITYESWDAQDEITDDLGNVTQSARDAGEIYMIRPDEFMFWRLAYIEKLLSR